MRKVLTLFVLLTGAAFASPSVGIVNFQTCVTESKYGLREQTEMEKVKEQMESLVKDLDKKLKDLNEKLSDSEYLDTLSPEGEQELKSEFQLAQEEMQRYQGQYYQVMQQTQMRLSQVVAQHVAKASELVAKEKKLDQIVHKDVCFFADPKLDVTSKIIEKMDEAFAKEEKENANVAKADK